MYHVMARGNQGRAIFKDDEDRHRFIATLADACGKTGWRIHAYVLMGNHYHLLVETPEGNLVAGMKWLQGTYTQRYNLRHAVRGHLFQGRYKAVPVESGNAGYLETVSTYIHLNPARAGLIRIGKEPLKRYRWSSYPSYLQPAGRGPVWLERGRVLGALRLGPEDRRGYASYVEGRVLELGRPAAKKELEAQWHALRRGWYVGGEPFGAKLREKLDRLLRGLRRESHSGPGKREHGERAAEQLLQQGLAKLGLSAAELEGGRRVTPEKAALAAWLREQTTVSLRWLAERLAMGHYSNAGGSFHKLKPDDVRKARQAQAKLAAITTKT
jgi:REP element-mobilizing transposase RayT